jgi:fumarate reductase subunit D
METIKTHFTVELMLMLLMMTVCMWAAVHYYNHDRHSTNFPTAEKKSAAVWFRF